MSPFLEPIQSCEDKPFSGQKCPICPEQSFLGTNHYYYFHLPIGPLHCAKFKKILERIQSYENASFLSPKIYPKQIYFFLEKFINTIFIYLLVPFIVQNFKIILSTIQSYEDAPFLGPRWPNLPK